MNKLKIFIAGPRAIKELDENVLKKLESICQKKYDILVGDADGIDSSVQIFLYKQNYKNVIVYASKGLARNNYGKWGVQKVLTADNLTGFDFYAQKDLQMAKDTDIGFMIWNGKSKGTFNNMINLLNFEKKVILYYVPTKKFYQFKQMSDLEGFINANVKLDSKLKKLLPEKEKIDNLIQVCLF